MVPFLFLTIGVILILCTFLDIVFTTYSMEGGGKLTNFYLQTSWKFFLWISGHDGRHKLLGLAGMFMMISLILLWGLGMWIGMFFILASDPDDNEDFDVTQEAMDRGQRARLIRKTRIGLGLSQAEFAARFHVPVGTLRDWEQARATAPDFAVAYVQVIGRYPDIVAQAVA